MNSTVKIILTQDGPLSLTEDAHGSLRPEVPTRLSAEGWDELNTLLENCSVESAWRSADGWELMSDRGSTISIYDLLMPLEGSKEDLVVALCDAFDTHLSSYGFKAVEAAYDANVLCWKATSQVKLEAQVQEIVVSKNCYECGAELEDWYDVSEALTDPTTGYVVPEALCEDCLNTQEEKIRKRTES